MSDWILAGIGITLFIAGFNIGQDLKYKKGFFRKKRTCTYWISCIYSVKGNSTVGGWAFDFDSEMTKVQLESFQKRQETNLKNKFETDDVEFYVIDFKKLKD